MRAILIGSAITLISAPVIGFISLTAFLSRIDTIWDSEE